MVPEQLRSNLSSSILSSVESDGAHLHLALRLIRRIELDSSCSSVGYSAGLSRRRSARISISDYLCIASIDLSSSRLIPLWIYCFTWSRLLMIDAELRIVTYDLITEIFEMHICFLYGVLLFELYLNLELLSIFFRLLLPLKMPGITLQFGWCLKVDESVASQIERFDIDEGKFHV
ncbi:hypothetical protein DY000_02061193 [Brassica cretica]|uniref:Uncharacterized protein n=1 Tax=Brassica cretica TaxID=69181 RepID=A0ABQ7AZV3_BRACR|nr:hypothetical protein DY000_02061193 [Brassica cretica]